MPDPRDSTRVPRVLYISCSSYSGSTLLSFLLNTHSGIFTIGHTTGWHYAEDEEFLCSCGAALAKCPFYSRLAAAFRDRGLEFDFRDFGTEYRVSKNYRLNQALVGRIPFVRSSLIENFRDAIVGRLPGIAGKLHRQHRANLTLIETAMDYAGASCYVDNSHTPYRVRHLRRLPNVDLRVIHLVRDPRGIALSNRKRKSWQPSLATRVWLREQADIIRLTGPLGDRVMRLHYEDICDDINGVLERIHTWAGLEHEPFEGDFKATEHHILGNVMRLGGGEVTRDTRWQTELSEADLESVSRAAREFLGQRGRSDLDSLVGYYLRDLQPV